MRSFKANGTWEYKDYRYKPTGGDRTALQIAVARDFEIEGVLEFGNEGGMFWLLGWDFDSGYVLPYSGLRTTAGTAINRIDDGKPNFDKDVTSGRHARLRGDTHFRIIMINKRLTLEYNDKPVFKNVELPDYEEGAIMLGTFPSQYGARPLNLKALRVRAR